MVLPPDDMPPPGCGPLSFRPRWAGHDPGFARYLMACLIAVTATIVFGISMSANSQIVPAVYHDVVGPVTMDAEGNVHPLPGSMAVTKGAAAAGDPGADPGSPASSDRGDAPGASDVAAPGADASPGSDAGTTSGPMWFYEVLVASPSGGSVLARLMPGETTRPDGALLGRSLGVTYITDTSGATAWPARQTRFHEIGFAGFAALAGAAGLVVAGRRARRP